MKAKKPKPIKAPLVDEEEPSQPSSPPSPTSSLAVNQVDQPKNGTATERDSDLTTTNDTVDNMSNNINNINNNSDNSDNKSSAHSMTTTTSFASTVHWWPTFTALCRKNVLLTRSAKWQYGIVMALPLVAMALTYTMQRVAENWVDEWIQENDDAAANGVAKVHVLTSPATQAVKPCAWYDVYDIESTTDCATIVYAPYTPDDTQAVNAIMQHIATEANLPFAPITGENDIASSSSFSYLDPNIWSGGTILGVPSVAEVGQFLVEHPGRAQAIVYFASPVGTPSNGNATTNTTLSSSSSSSSPLIYFKYNRTQNNIPMALNRAVLALTQNKSRINIRIAKRNMFAQNNKKGQEQTQQTTTTTANNNQDEDDEEAQRKQDLKQVSTDVVAALLGPILVFSICMSAALLANQAAAEKTNGLIGSLRVVGMADSAYWMSWYTVQLIVVVIPACALFIALAYILDIALVTEVNVLVLLVTLICQYSVILALHYCAVAIATNRAFLYALYFCLLCLCVTSVSLAPAFAAGPGDRVGKAFGYAVPGYHLGAVLDSMYRFNTRAGYSLEAARANYSTYDWDEFWDPFGRCNQTVLEDSNYALCQEIPMFDDATCWKYVDCGGMAEDEIWNDDYCAPDSCYFYPMADATRVGIMLAQTVIWIIFAWYFLQVLPSGNGLTYPPWFFVQVKYWLGARTSMGGSTANMSREQRQSKTKGSIVLKGLTKTFSGNTAVNNVDMKIKNGQVFVLLGHNGAGKSTLINMLTGKLSPTSGEAYVMGLSIKDNIHGIQRLVSCVPQHDLLWGELSAKEHIRLFAKIKGVSRKDLVREVDKVLQRVHLAEAANQPAGGYSGGMKRRLSIALAGIGGPKVIMLDEPTTGIDPLNRRRIWNLVRELKRDRIVVLTTHLMQEADCLGDQIAVLDNGTIQAQGTPLNLKTEHGSGYSLSIVTDAANVERVKSLAREMMPNVELVNEAAGSLAFGVHTDELAAIPLLTRQLQSEGLIREWNISQSTIEEVFLRLASQSVSMQNRHQQMQNVAASRQPGAVGTSHQTELEPIQPDIDEERGVPGDTSEVFAPAAACWRLQLAALLRKTFILRKRHWIATIVQLAIPIALVAIAKKFFFKDMKVEPWEVLVWPQAKTFNPSFHGYNQPVFGEQQCSFEWDIWSKTTKTDRSPIETLTNAKAAVASIEFPQLYGDGPNRLSFQVSGMSGISSSEVEEALVDAMKYYLSRTSSETTQNEADAYCGGDTSCGPCLVADFQVREIDGNRVEYIVDGTAGGYMQRCQSSFSFCGLDVYKIMLTDPEITTRVSQTLSVPIKVESLQFHAQSTISMSVLIRTPTLEVKEKDDLVEWSSCASCRDSVPHLWITGQNALSFQTSLAEIATDFTSKVVESNILETLSKNRQSLENNAVSFSNPNPYDLSACAALGNDNRLANDAGYIVNTGDIRVWPGSNVNNEFRYDGSIDGAMCNSTIEPLAHYRTLFPDAGITLAAFDITKDSVTVDLVWEIDMDNYYYRYFGNDGDSFGPSQQSVYALYCPPEQANADGSCTEEADLMCVRAVPYSGCDGYSYYVSNDDLVEKTYVALWSASGLGEGGPVVQRMSEEIPVDYAAAVDLDELALFVFMITVAVALYAPNVASVLVFEKNQRFIFAMLLNGLKVHVYWAAQYLSHLITTGVLGAVAIILGVVLQLPPFTSQEPNAGLLIVVLLSGIHAQFGFIVLLSSFFKKERFAAVLVGFVVLIMLGTAILTHLASQSKLKSGWPPALSLLPMFGFFRCLLLVFWKRYYDEMWQHIGVMLGSSTLYLLLGIYRQTSTGVGALFKWDCGLFSHIFHGTSASTPAEADNDEDDLAEADIANEEHRALKLSPDDTAIKITHLGKTFPGRPPKHAVIDVTMAMDGEIFGLLGPNGAGKTTVISMLVGQLTPSRGQAFVAGYDTVEERRAALSKLGIVPQFDVYYPELTVREHLMLYAAMKGVKPSKQDSWAQSIASTVGLGGDDLFHRQASALSGGMRRRLSIAVALLSKPSCLFLDEPTTGLDPEMKRSIWSIIERMRQDRCVILTTHAMDEAEALCDRIGIMAKGSLKCIGTQKELRERYGSTYELTFTVPKGTAKNDEALQQYLLRRCPSTSLVSNFGETRVFTVDKSDLELSDLFEVIIHARSENLFTEWGINNTSLDEVFIAITAESEGVGAGEL